MKVNYRTHPILEKIEKTTFNREVYCYDEDWNYISRNYIEINQLFNIASIRAKDNINVLSGSFIEAINLAYEKLDELLIDIFYDSESILDISGVYILPRNVLILDYHKLRKEAKGTFFSFNKSGIIESYMILNRSKKDDEGDLILWTTNLSGMTEEERKDYARKLLHGSMIIHMFKTYAQVETKYLPAGQRLKEINCKYINETKLNLTYLDSKWFTNLVKSDAFKVRGHFRLQPKKKDGEWIRELIWINDFMKNGYTSPARKLSMKD